MPELSTRPQLAELGHQRQFGAPDKLWRLHREWVEYGLLAGSVRKESRPGGQGLYGQADLWLNYLERRRRGEAPAAFSAIPIALWMLGRPDISVDQAQRALAFHLRPYTDTGVQRGKRSTRYRQLRHAAQRLSRRNRPTRLYQFLDAVDRDPTRPPRESEVVDEFIESNFNRPAEQVLGLAQGMHGLHEVQHRALMRIRWLTGPQATQLWEWARQIYRLTWNSYVLAGPQGPAPDLFDPTLENLVLDAPGNLLTILGIGLDPNYSAKAPQGLPPPPTARQ